MRKMFFLLALLASNFLNAQQKPDPINEQWTFFPYAVGERTDKKLQVLIIGTHLIRFKTLTNGQDVNVQLSLDFGKMIDEIQKNERYHPNDYDNIGFSATRVEDLNGNYLKWHGEVIRNNDLSSNDNTLSAMEKIRTKLIDSYRARGYKIYQVDFKMDVEHSYKYYDISVPSYKPMQFERLSPLSPLYVRVYQRGEIKDLLSRINRAVLSTGTPGLVIESSNDKKQNNNSGSGSGGSVGTSHKMTDEEIRIDISYRKTLAESAAAEGDRYYQMGAMGYMSALEKYKQAQAQYYSPDVQRRIDEISGWVALGQSFNKLSEGMDNMAASVDPNKKTRWVYWGLTYGGFGGNYSKISNGANHQPMEGLFVFTGHRLCFSFETRIGYFKSPVYEYIVTVNANNPETPYKVQTENSAIGLGLSGGLNIPLKSLVLYGMIGIDMKLFNVSYKMMPSQFSFVEDVSALDFPAFDTRISIGAAYRIPKSKVGFKVEYVMHDIKGEDDGATAIKYSANPSGKYYLKKTTDEKYQFGNYSVGINFAL